MSSRKFFILSLLLPLIIAGLGYAIPGLDGLAFLFAVAAVPYLATALCLGVLIAKARTLRRLLVLSLVAPFLFGALLAAFVMTVGSVPEIQLALGEHASQALGVAFVGGAYAVPCVATAWLLWAAGRRMNWVANEFAA